jgi:hypothetical protein
MLMQSLRLHLSQDVKLSSRCLAYMLGLLAGPLHRLVLRIRTTSAGLILNFGAKAKKKVYLTTINGHGHLIFNVKI